MNHNGVISLPTDGSSTYASGEIVAIAATTGQAGTPVASGGGLDAIGVVLHDVKADETARPVDVQLFSAGGAALIKCAGVGMPTAIGAACYIKENTSTLLAASSNAKLVGYALEAGSASGTIRVVLV